MKAYGTNVHSIAEHLNLTYRESILNRNPPSHAKLYWP